MADRDCTAAPPCGCALDDDEELLTPDEAEDRAIDGERGRLMQASSILGCLEIAMCEAEAIISNRDGPFYPDAVAAARTLVDQAIHNLDSVSLQQVRYKAGEMPLPETVGSEAQGPPSPD